MQLFDSASRGPWGSAMLLWTHRGYSLASLGALITILAVTFDPFMQQLLSYFSRQVPSSLHASSVNLGHPASISVDLLHGEGLEALNTGIWTKVGPGLDPVCPSGNCTWPVFPSLGFCTKCEDATASAALAGCQNVPFNSTSSSDDLEPVSCTITLPSPLLPVNISMNLRNPYASGDLILSVPQEAMALIQSTGSYSLAGVKSPLSLWDHPRDARATESPWQHYKGRRV